MYQTNNKFLKFHSRIVLLLLISGGCTSVFEEGSNTPLLFGSVDVSKLEGVEGNPEPGSPDWPLVVTLGENIQIDGNQDGVFTPTQGGEPPDSAHERGSGSDFDPNELREKFFKLERIAFDEFGAIEKLDSVPFDLIPIQTTRQWHLVPYKDSGRTIRGAANLGSIMFSIGGIDAVVLGSADPNQSLLHRYVRKGQGTLYSLLYFPGIGQALTPPEAIPLVLSDHFPQHDPGLTPSGEELAPTRFYPPHSPLRLDFNRDFCNLLLETDLDPENRLLTGLASRKAKYSATEADFQVYWDLEPDHTSTISIISDDRHGSFNTETIFAATGSCDLGEFDYLRCNDAPAMVSPGYYPQISFETHTPDCNGLTPGTGETEIAASYEFKFHTSHVRIEQPVHQRLLPYDSYNVAVKARVVEDQWGIGRKLAVGFFHSDGNPARSCVEQELVEWTEDSTVSLNALPHQQGLRYIAAWVIDQDVSCSDLTIDVSTESLVSIDQPDQQADIIVVQQPFCGDGLINGAEVCDDGQNSECGDCNADCSSFGFGLGECGDGVLCPENGESCDDGNPLDGDGCDSSCALEYTSGLCGDGIVNAVDEVCDDGGVCINNALQTCDTPGEACGNGLFAGVCNTDAETGINYCIEPNSQFCRVSNQPCNPIECTEDREQIVGSEISWDEGYTEGGWSTLTSTGYNGGSGLVSSDTTNLFTGNFRTQSPSALFYIWHFGYRNTTVGADRSQIVSIDDLLVGIYDDSDVPSVSGPEWQFVGTITLSEGLHTYTVSGSTNDTCLFDGYVITTDVNMDPSAQFLPLTSFDLDDTALDYFDDPNICCGNCVIDSGEECDPGDAPATDNGCSATCELIGAPVPSASCTSNCHPFNGDACESCQPVCVNLNGILEAGEQCDDGNELHGDGCEPNCRCTDGDCEILKALTCGNGLLDNAEEQCDDGSYCLDLTMSVVSCLGCPHECVYHAGLRYCIDPEVTVSCNYNEGLCEENERCVRTSGDGCNESCVCEEDGCESLCGDGKIDSEIEQCDDGGAAGGCPNNCQCGDACIHLCGNGVLDSIFEECDDGNHFPNDSCNQFCRCVDGDCSALCGDGIVNTQSEMCDNLGNTSDCNCLADCTLPYCGDGIQCGSEVCDDGNSIETDGCLQNCTLECQSSSVFIAGTVDGGTWPNDLYLDGDTLYSSSSAFIFALIFFVLYPELEVYDFSDPFNPTRLNITSLVFNDLYSHSYGIAIENEYAYITHNNGFRIVDITNPAQPNVIGNFPPTGLEMLESNLELSIPKVAVDHPYVFLTIHPNYLLIADVSDPTNPNMAGLFTLQGTPIDITIDDNHLFLALGDDGVEIIDLGSTPTSPFSIARLDTPGFAGQIAVSGSLMHVADGSQGVQIVDISQLDDPEILSNISSPNSANDVAVNGETLVVMHDDSVEIVNIEDVGHPQKVGGYSADLPNIISHQLESIVMDDHSVYLASGGLGGFNYTGYIVSINLASCQLDQCGNGILEAGEECDDGIQNGSPGFCSRTCQGWISTICGNGILSNPEECDDGANRNGDGCNDLCLFEYCGDGFVNNQDTEECDDGNLSDGDGCDAVCSLEFCGDGIINNQNTEQCDDNNEDDEDQCRNDCTINLCYGLSGGDDCDDGLACTVRDKCFSGKCHGVSKSCADLVTICQVGVCDESSGGCVLENGPNGKVCSDDNVCTLNDVCLDGLCEGVPIACGANEICVDGNCLDGGSMGIVILAPSANQYINSTEVVVEGVILDSTIQNISVHGQTALIEDNRFSTILSLPEGSSAILIKVFYTTGPSTETTLPVIVDVTSPLLEILTPPEGLVTDSSLIEVVGTVSDIHLNTVKLNGTELSVLTSSFTHSLELREGINIINLTAVDLAGNTSTTIREVILNTTPPELILRLIVEGDSILYENEQLKIATADQPIALIGNVVASSEIIAEVNGITCINEDLTEDPVPCLQSNWAKAFVFDMRSVDPGSHEITVTVTDEFGFTITKMVTVIYDNQPPDLTVNPLTGSPPYQTMPLISGSVTDETEITLTVDGNEVSVQDDSSFEAYPPGNTVSTLINHIATVTAVDYVGNTTSQEISFPIDFNAPGIVLDQPLLSSSQPVGPMALTGTLFENESTASLEVNGQSVSIDSDGRFSHIYNVVSDLQTLTLIATDVAGNTSDLEYEIFGESRTPVLLLDSSPVATVYKDEFLFSGSIENADLVLRFIINDKIVPLKENDHFTVPYSLDPGLNAIELDIIDLWGRHYIQSFYVTYSQTGKTTRTTSNGTVLTLPTGSYAPGTTIDIQDVSNETIERMIGYRFTQIDDVVQGSFPFEFKGAISVLLGTDNGFIPYKEPHLKFSGLGTPPGSPYRYNLYRLIPDLDGDGYFDLELIVREFSTVGGSSAQYTGEFDKQVNGGIRGSLERNVSLLQFVEAEAASMIKLGKSNRVQSAIESTQSHLPLEHTYLVLLGTLHGRDVIQGQVKPRIQPQIPESYVNEQGELILSGIMDDESYAGGTATVILPDVPGNQILVTVPIEADGTYNIRELLDDGILANLSSCQTNRVFVELGFQTGDLGGVIVGIVYGSLIYVSQVQSGNCHIDANIAPEIYYVVPPNDGVLLAPINDITDQQSGLCIEIIYDDFVANTYRSDNIDDWFVPLSANLGIVPESVRYTEVTFPIIRAWTTTEAETVIGGELSFCFRPEGFDALRRFINFKYYVERFLIKSYSGQYAKFDYTVGFSEYDFTSVFVYNVEPEEGSVGIFKDSRQGTLYPLQPCNNSETCREANRPFNEGIQLPNGILARPVQYILDFKVNIPMETCEELIYDDADKTPISDIYSGCNDDKRCIFKCPDDSGEQNLCVPKCTESNLGSTVDLSQLNNGFHRYYHPPHKFPVILEIGDIVGRRITDSTFENPMKIVAYRPNGVVDTNPVEIELEWEWDYENSVTSVLVYPVNKLVGFNLDTLYQLKFVETNNESLVISDDGLPVSPEFIMLSSSGNSMELTDSLGFFTGKTAFRLDKITDIQKPDPSISSYRTNILQSNGPSANYIWQSSKNKYNGQLEIFEGLQYDYFESAEGICYYKIDESTGEPIDSPPSCFTAASGSWTGVGDLDQFSTSFMIDTNQFSGTYQILAYSVDAEPITTYFDDQDAECRNGYDVSYVNVFPSRGFLSEYRVSYDAINVYYPPLTDSAEEVYISDMGLQLFRGVEPGQNALENFMDLPSIGEPADLIGSEGQEIEIPCNDSDGVDLADALLEVQLSDIVLPEIDLANFLENKIFPFNTRLGNENDEKYGINTIEKISDFAIQISRPGVEPKVELSLDSMCEMLFLNPLPPTNENADCTIKGTFFAFEEAFLSDLLDDDVFSPTNPEDDENDPDDDYLYPLHFYDQDYGDFYYSEPVSENSTGLAANCSYFADSLGPLLALLPGMDVDLSAIGEAVEYLCAICDLAHKNIYAREGCILTQLNQTLNDEGDECKTETETETEDESKITAEDCEKDYLEMSKDNFSIRLDSPQFSLYGGNTPIAIRYEAGRILLSIQLQFSFKSFCLGYEYGDVSNHECISDDDQVSYRFIIEAEVYPEVVDISNGEIGGVDVNWKSTVTKFDIPLSNILSEFPLEKFLLDSLAGVITKVEDCTQSFRRCFEKPDNAVDVIKDLAKGMLENVISESLPDLLHLDLTTEIWRDRIPLGTDYNDFGFHDFTVGTRNYYFSPYVINPFVNLNDGIYIKAE